MVSSRAVGRFEAHAAATLGGPQPSGQSGVRYRREHPTDELLGHAADQPGVPAREHVKGAVLEGDGVTLLAGLEAVGLEQVEHARPAGAVRAYRLAELAPQTR